MTTTIGSETPTANPAGSPKTGDRASAEHKDTSHDSQSPDFVKDLHDAARRTAAGAKSDPAPSSDSASV